MRTPTVEWQLAGGCNYDCSYCIQSRKTRRGGVDRDLAAAALDLLGALPGEWEIKISGGEPFAHPPFATWIVPSLMADTAHRVSVLTNFSADTRTLFRFAAATRGRLSVFSASFHPEHADAGEFADKARWFGDLLEADARLVVNQVVLPGRVADAARCRTIFEDRGLRWFPQLCKEDGRVATYPDADELAALVGDDVRPRDANTAPSYRGRSCWAGVDYLVLDRDGRAWSCRTARRHARGSLGSVREGEIRRRTRPRPCPFSICPCTVPANRGMVQGVGAAGVL